MIIALEFGWTEVAAYAIITLLGVLVGLALTK